MNKLYVVTVFVPNDYADNLRKVVGDAGGGKMGDYSHCSFSSTGKGRFLPNKDANPAIGSTNEYTTVEEERIEFVVEEQQLSQVLKELQKNTHMRNLLYMYKKC